MHPACERCGEDLSIGYNEIGGHYWACRECEEGKSYTQNIKLLTEEKILGVTIGSKYPYFDFSLEKEDRYNKWLSWREAKSFLNYPYEVGSYGSSKVHPVWVWTAHWIVITEVYDGANHLIRIPRSLSNGEPKYIGGGF